MNIQKERHAHWQQLIEGQAANGLIRRYLPKRAYNQADIEEIIKSTHEMFRVQNAQRGIF